MPAHAQIDNAGQLTDRARFVSDTIRISERGEARAGSLELIGWLMVVVALLGGAAAAWVAAGTDDLSDAERAFVAVSLGSMLTMTVGAGLVLAFAALVRNSSRSLTIAAVNLSTHGGRPTSSPLPPPP